MDGIALVIMFVVVLWAIIVMGISMGLLAPLPWRLRGRAGVSARRENTTPREPEG